MKPFKMGITDLLEGQQDFQLPLPNNPASKKCRIFELFHK